MHSEIHIVIALQYVKHWILMHGHRFTYIVLLFLMHLINSMTVVAEQNRIETAAATMATKEYM